MVRYGPTHPLILARSTGIFWRARAPYLLVESLNVILNFEKLRESGKRKESFPLPPPPSSPSHTITLGVDDRQACNPPNKASPEHSTCFCTSHQLWKMWLVESIQPGKFACLASKLFVRVVELNLFFFQFYPEVWTVCRIWCIYLGARAVKSMDIWWYHALGARQEFVSHLFFRQAPLWKLSSSL